MLPIDAAAFCMLGAYGNSVPVLEDPLLVSSAFFLYSITVGVCIFYCKKETSDDKLVFYI